MPPQSSLITKKTHSEAHNDVRKSDHGARNVHRGPYVSLVAAMTIMTIMTPSRLLLPRTNPRVGPSQDVRLDQTFHGPHTGSTTSASHGYEEGSY